MKKLLAVVFVLVSGSAFACPDNTIEVYNGDEIAGVCYQESGRNLYWQHVAKVCVAESGASIVYERDRVTREERLVGVCNGTFETRP
jgi:hypothetical protein